MADVRINVSGEFDLNTSPAENKIDQVEKKLDQVGKRPGATSTPGGSGRDKAIEKENQALQRQAQLQEKLLRIQKDFSRELGKNVSPSQARSILGTFGSRGTSGAFGSGVLKSFADPSSWLGGYRSQFGSKPDADRHYRETMASMLRSAGISQGGGGGMGGRWAGAAGGMLGSMMAGGGGGMGSTVGGLAGAGIGAAFGGPAGIFAGALLGKLGGSVDEGMGRAQNEAIGTTDLRRMLGALSTDFDSLRSATRAAADGMGVSYEESVKLAQSFAKVSGGGLEGFRDSMGFARGLGLDPSQGVGFFANMKRTGTAGDEQSMRKQALIMGEAIAKSGGFSQAGELLTAVTNFSTAAARGGLSAPNVADYAGSVSSLMARGIPGLKDAEGAAGLVSRMDAGLRSNHNEAARNLMLAAGMHNLPGMSGMDLDYLTAGGLFGSGASQFRVDGPAYLTASPAKKAQMREWVKSGKTLGSMVSEEIENTYKDQPDLINHAYSSVFGLAGANEGAAARLALQKQGGFGGLKSKLAGYGIDTDRINTSSIPMLAELAGADHSKLTEYREKFQGGGLLKGAIDAAEKSALSGAKDDEELRRALLQTGSKHDLADEGDKTRNSLKDVENAITAMGGALIPATNAVRDAVLFAAGETPEAFEANRRKLAVANEQAAVDAASRQYQEANSGPTGDDRSRRVRAATDNLWEKQRALKIAQMVQEPSKYDILFQTSAAKRGVDWRDLKQIAAQESGLNPNAAHTNPDGTIDRGMMQLHSKYDKSRGVTNPFDPSENIDAGAKVWADALRQAKGDKHEAMRIYNGSGPAAEAYADRAMQVQDKLPQDHHSAASTPSANPSQQHDFRFSFYDLSRGMEIAPPIVTQFGAPKMNNFGQ